MSPKYRHTNDCGPSGRASVVVLATDDSLSSVMWHSVTRFVLCNKRLGAAGRQHHRQALLPDCCRTVAAQRQLAWHDSLVNQLRSVTRRTALRLGVTGVGAAGLWALGALPDATRAAPAPLSTPLPTREEGSFISAARGGRNTRWIIARPPGQTGPLRTVIALHGLDSDAASVMSLGVEDALAKLPATGKPSIAVVSVDGGNGYWRPRASGEDSGAMVLNELIPMLASKGLDTSQVAFMGWSMGGYGAMRLCSRLGAGRTFAVCAISPASIPDLLGSAARCLRQPR